MRRILGLTFVVSLFSFGPAWADRDHRHGGGGGGGEFHGGGHAVAHGHVHARGGPVRIVGGRYMFPGGVVRVYHEPHHVHFYNVHTRPAVLVENYEPMEGYVWVRGNWRWGGSEWMWTPGYYSVATATVAAPAAAVNVHVQAPSVHVNVPPPPPPPSVNVSAGFHASAGAGVGVH